MATPVKSFKAGQCQVAVWGGEKGYNVSTSKRYKDKESGEWKESKVLFAEEAFVMAGLLQAAGIWCLAQVKQPSQAPAPKAVQQQFDDSDVPF